MQTTEFIEIIYNEKRYNISIENVSYVLSKLTQKDIKNIQQDEIIPLMKKYCLFDEVFLNEINDLFV